MLSAPMPPALGASATPPAFPLRVDGSTATAPFDPTVPFPIECARIFIALNSDGLAPDLSHATKIVRISVSVIGVTCRPFREGGFFIRHLRRCTRNAL